MAICPKCSTEYPKILMRCPNDGFYTTECHYLESSGHDPMIGRFIDEKYAIYALIGRGGMGSVYLARHFGLQRDIALKILSGSLEQNPFFAERFHIEAETASRINHPNIVRVYGADIDKDGMPYIAMEYVSGRLLSYISEAELTTSLVLHLTGQILGALLEAHKQGVVHRDLKPDNIMICQVGSDPYTIKILDFGLARIMNDEAGKKDAQTLGTPWYMSPEQIMGLETGAASDIYSLGCIVYELLTSQPPFTGTRPLNVLMQQTNTPVPPLIPRASLVVSPALEKFVMRCLEKSLDRRYKDAAEALQMLQRVPEWESVSLANPSLSLKLRVEELLAEKDIQSKVMALEKPRSPQLIRPSSQAIRKISRSDVSIINTGESQALKPLPVDKKILRMIKNKKFWVACGVLLVFVIWITVLF